MEFMDFAYFRKKKLQLMQGYTTLSIFSASDSLQFNLRQPMFLGTGPGRKCATG